MHTQRSLFINLMNYCFLIDVMYNKNLIITVYGNTHFENKMNIIVYKKLGKIYNNLVMPLCLKKLSQTRCVNYVIPPLAKYSNKIFYNPIIKYFIH